MPVTYKKRRYQNAPFRAVLRQTRQGAAFPPIRGNRLTEPILVTCPGSSALRRIRLTATNETVDVSLSRDPRQLTGSRACTVHGRFFFDESVRFAAATSHESEVQSSRNHQTGGTAMWVSQLLGQCCPRARTGPILESSSSIRASASSGATAPSIDSLDSWLASSPIASSTTRRCES